MTTSIATFSFSTTGSAVFPKTPEGYRTRLMLLLTAYIERLQVGTKMTLNEIARERLGWERGNHLTQLQHNSVLSPASTLKMAEALELDEEETDELVFVTMRANADRGSQMSLAFLARYEKAFARRLCAAAKKRGIHLS